VRKSNASNSSGSTPPLVAWGVVRGEVTDRGKGTPSAKKGEYGSSDGIENTSPSSIVTRGSQGLAAPSEDPWGNSGAKSCLGVSSNRGGKCET